VNDCQSVIPEGEGESDFSVRNGQNLGNLQLRLLYCMISENYVSAMDVVKSEYSRKVQIINRLILHHKGGNNNMCCEITTQQETDV